MFLILFERHAPPTLAAFRSLMLASPQVQVCLEVSGAYDIACLATFRSMEEFNAFADANIANDPVVRRYEASFVKRRIKMSTAIPL